MVVILPQFTPGFPSEPGRAVDVATRRPLMHHPHADCAKLAP